MAIRAEKVKELREKLGLSQSELARRVGVKPQSVQQLEDGKVANPRYLPQLAKALGVDWESLQSDYRPTQLSDLPPQVHPEETTELPSRTSMPSDVPVYGTAVGGDNGDFRFNGMEVDFVRRPPGLEKIKSAFAIYLYGESMSPRFEHGELLYIHPGQPVKQGDYVLVELHGEDGENGACYVKRLVRRSPDKLVLQQFNPPDDSIEIPADRVKSVLKILTPTELLGA